MRFTMYFLWCLLAIVISSGVQAAVVSGRVYDWNLEIVKNAIVDIDTEPTQSLITNDGFYSFNISPGDYEVSSIFYKKNLIEARGRQKISLKEGDGLEQDIVLFPVFEDDMYLIDSPINFRKSLAQEQKLSKPVYYSIISGTFVLTILLLFFILKKARKRKKDNPDTKQKDDSESTADGSGDDIRPMPEASLPIKNEVSQKQEVAEIEYALVGQDERDGTQDNMVDSSGSLSDEPMDDTRPEPSCETLTDISYSLDIDEQLAPVNYDVSGESLQKDDVPDEQKLQERRHNKDIAPVLEFIEKQGGRITQKDIRRNFPSSEAKISLVLTELEAKGLITKIKKGRGNIICLKQDKEE